MPAKARFRDDVDLEILLNCALSHKADHIRAFLKQAKLPKSGAKDVLRERLREFLEEDSRRALLLTEYLNLIEGWGNQHLYLYKAPTGVCRRWRSEDHVCDVLRRNRVLGIMNKPRTVVLPEEPTLASIRWSPKGARFIWTEKRVWYERREDEDTDEDDGRMLYRAWERKTARGTLAFDWDLGTGDAMIMIQRLPSGTHYAKVRDEMINWLAPYVDAHAFEVVRVSAGIRSIQGSPTEARERKVNWETVQGGKASFTSPGRRHGVGADATLRRMEAAGKEDVHGSLGNFYWLPSEGSELEEDLHTVLHKKDQRVGIMGEKLEQEVRYVVGRIRAHCA